MAEEKIIRKIVEVKDSYEFGPASRRFNLHFSTPEELNNKIKKLKELGILKDD